MGGVTAAGIPYVTPDDHPKEYPAASQQLAETLSQGYLPIGAVIAYASTAAPTGWHLCDGTPHGSPELADLIGPNAPDLRGRFVLAASNGRPAGQTGGAETVALSVAEMPSHAHGGATAAMNGNQAHGHTGTADWVGDHVHGTRRGQGGVEYPVHSISEAAGGWTSDPPTDAAGSHSHSLSVNAANIDHAHGVYAEGSGAAHENMPPYYALTYIIKAV